MAVPPPEVATVATEEFGLAVPAAEEEPAPEEEPPAGPDCCCCCILVVPVEPATPTSGVLIPRWAIPWGVFQEFV